MDRGGDQPQEVAEHQGTPRPQGVPDCLADPVGPQAGEQQQPKDREHRDQQVLGAELHHRVDDAVAVEPLDVLEERVVHVPGPCL